MKNKKLFLISTFYFLLSIVLLAFSIRNIAISPVGLGQFTCFFIAMVSAAYAFLYVVDILRRFIGFRMPPFLEMGE